MPTSEAQKRANQKWRDKNKDKYNAICCEAAKNHYINNKDAISAYKKEWYKQKKEKQKEIEL
tara:strand:+ start:735 stop:920 length:186 start_codon:yes stop_codon:yes gene_type:complete